MAISLIAARFIELGSGCSSGAFTRSSNGADRIRQQSGNFESASHPAFVGLSLCEPSASGRKWPDQRSGQLTPVDRSAQSSACTHRRTHLRDGHEAWNCANKPRSRMARGRAAMSFDSRAKCLEMPFMLLPFFGGPTPRISCERGSTTLAREGAPSNKTSRFGSFIRLLGGASRGHRVSWRAGGRPSPRCWL